MANSAPCRKEFRRDQFTSHSNLIFLAVHYFRKIVVGICILLMFIIPNFVAVVNSSSSSSSLSSKNETFKYLFFVPLLGLVVTPSFLEERISYTPSNELTFETIVKKMTATWDCKYLSVLIVLAVHKKGKIKDIV